ncbi:MAG TPA: DUF1294 domain-containing protein [Planctomycetota bacterium]|nr:DUF1294 domain-containing protein [Planctomycetota bacterium]
MKLLAFYVVAINVLAYGVYWLDKRRAQRGGRRVSERELLMWAAVGGSLGSWLAMRRLRHKTRKAGFRIAFFAIVLAQAAALYFLGPWS